MLAKRLIKSNDAGGGACTNTVDLYNPFPDGGGVALYQLNGDATDESGNYNGTPTNVTYGTGVFGQASVFDIASQSQIQLPTGSPFDDSDTIKTISCWFKLTGSDSIRYFSISDGGFNFFSLTATNNGIYYLVRNGASANQLSANSLQTIDNNWHHVAYVYDPNGIKIYLDGQEQTVSYTASGTATNSSWISYPAYSGTPIAYIGRSRQNSPTYSDGSIDQVRIFSRALRPYEVEALYTEEYCTPTIVPSEHFNTVTYTGNGGTQSITSLGFQPDFVWIKNRTEANNHVIFDSVRGDSNSNGYYDRISPNLTTAEQGDITDAVQTLDANGFTVHSAGDGSQVNDINDNYVAWNFKAGGAAVAAASIEATGATRSANPEAGFSIIKFQSSASTVQPPPMNYIEHGLNSAPKMVIYKVLNQSQYWIVQHDGITTNGDLRLNLTDAQSGPFTYDFFNNTETSIGVRSNYAISRDEPYIAYCFAEVEGFSNFGSYVGTGTTSGNTIVTGFEPAFIMVKSSSLARNWHIFDNKRVNGQQHYYLDPNVANAEVTSFDAIRFLENGFEFVQGDDQFNGSGASYIYMAFAADPTAVEPTLEDSFNTVLYTGDAGNTGNTLSQTVTGVGFQPDLVWGKNRDYANNHILFDSVRSPEKWLSSNNTNAESESIYTQATILSDGFTTGTADTLNRPNNDFVAWCWKGAEIPAINSNGSIPSVVSANPAAGFSIVSYTGNGSTGTIGHGLSSAPSMLIIKNRSSSTNWVVGSNEIGWNYSLNLNDTSAAGLSTNRFNATSPTSTVFSVGATSVSNGSGNSMIAYCFAEVAGFSKFGSYVGNGSTNGPTITTNFEPAFVMVKCSSDSNTNWRILDNKRSPSNPRQNNLIANLSDAENTGTNRMNFNANDFQLTTSNGDFNGSGRTYIYMAFANQF